MALLLYLDGVPEKVDNTLLTRAYLQEFVGGPLQYIYDCNGNVIMVTNAESLLLGHDINEKASELVTSVLGYEIHISGPAVCMLNSIDS